MKKLKKDQKLLGNLIEALEREEKREELPAIYDYDQMLFCSMEMGLTEDEAEREVDDFISCM